MGYKKDVKENDGFELIPEGWYTVKLLDVTPKQVGSGVKLKWKWEIVEGDYATRYVWGECWDNLDQSDGCVWRRWHEALVEREVPLGENIDTDDVLNFMAQVYVSYRSYYKDKIEDEAHLRWVAEISDDPESVQGINVDVDALGAPGSDGPEPAAVGAGVAAQEPPY